VKVAPHTDSQLEIEGIPDFWSRIRAAKYRFLGLDYDGTLAPFRAERMRAVPPPEVRELLERIRDTGRTHLCIVSGRPVGEILELLGDLSIPIVGVHGYEVKQPSFPVQVHLPPPRARSGLKVAQEFASARHDGALIEAKSATVAFHTRPISDSAKVPEDIEREWRQVAQDFNLSLREFNGGIELRARERNKGTAVLEILKSFPAAVLPVYLGDDETDEDVFRALRGQGYGIRVGRPREATAAQGILEDSDAVPEFLRVWFSVTEE
jgi:trehalose 6-phosphate phosphatase